MRGAPNTSPAPPCQGAGTVAVCPASDASSCPIDSASYSSGGPPFPVCSYPCCNPGSYVTCSSGTSWFNTRSCSTSNGSPASSGSFACSQCRAGTASSGVYYEKQAGYTDLTSCTPCSPGSFASAPGASACSKCPPGQFSDVVGSTACTSCPAGTYAGQVGVFTNTRCKFCPVNTFSSAGSPAGCEPCPDGTVSGSGAQSASACLPPSSALVCPANTFLDYSGPRAACQPCPSLSGSAAGANVCKCQTGTGNFYLDDRPNPTCMLCFLVPGGCPAAAAQAVQTSVKVAPLIRSSAAALRSLHALCALALATGVLAGAWA